MDNDKLETECARFELALGVVKHCLSLCNEAKGVIYGDVWADSEDLEFLLDDFSRNMFDLADLASDLNIALRAERDPEFAAMPLEERHDYLNKLLEGIEVDV